MSAPSAFRAAHHSATPAAIVGGGSGMPVPGELTLAHRGVIFLDELGEFPVRLLDSLRQPIEDGSVVIARKGVAVTYPTDVQVLAATNPCPCGFEGDVSRRCACSPHAKDRYRSRLSGPLLDRFDIRLRMPRLEHGVLAGRCGESSEQVRERVSAGRERQATRGNLNRNATREQLDSYDWSHGAIDLLSQALSRYDLSPRGWERIRRVALTIADLDESDAIGEGHVAEAMSYRVL